jgi:hypothetical protein
MRPQIASTLPDDYVNPVIYSRISHSNQRFDLSEITDPYKVDLRRRSSIALCVVIRTRILGFSRDVRFQKAACSRKLASFLGIEGTMSLFGIRFSASFLCKDIQVGELVEN